MKCESTLTTNTGRITAWQKSTQQMEMQAKRQSNVDLSGKMEKLIFEVKSKIARLIVENKSTLWKYFFTVTRKREKVGF